ncbi:hypothetical protein ACEXQD_17130 [Herbiconiux sp. P15]|uniref:hypothetical protein n=1 Tax=Herbiconiux liukaitaii TaxID=3342799 RepID=UPI0035B7CA21
MGREFVVPVFTDPSINGGVGNPAVALIAVVVGSFFGSALGAVVGGVVAVGLALSWRSGRLGWSGAVLVSALGVLVTVGVMILWFVDDWEIVLLALMGAPQLGAGVFLLEWMGRREVAMGARFYERAP